MGSAISTEFGFSSPPSETRTKESIIQEMQEKALEIEECLSNDPVNLWHLRELALTRGGLLQGSLRQRAWAKLVGLSETAEEDGGDPYAVEFQRRQKEKEKSVPSDASTRTQQQEEEMKKEDELEVDLIRRDVGRSVLFRYKSVSTDNAENLEAIAVAAAASSSSSKVAQDNLNPQQESTEEDWSVVTPTGQPSHEDLTAYTSNLAGALTPSYASDRLAQVLEDCITADNPKRMGKLHYYQGLHDIAGVVLHNMSYNVTATTNILRRVCQSHLRDAMRENFGNITWLLHVLLLPLIEQLDAHVHYAIVVSDVELSNVCLSWLITWFTHDIHHHSVAGRMVDAFLAGHPLLPLYFCVGLLTHPMLRKHILTGDYDDPASMFLVIKKLPYYITTDSAIIDDDESTTAVHAQELIEDAIGIMQRYPPRSLFDLVDPESMSRQEILNRVASVSLFKAPSSWSMAGLSSCAGSSSPLSSDGKATWSSANFLSNSDSSNVRAKLASGVPILMTTVEHSTLSSSPTWGSRRHVERAKRRRRLSKLAMYKRILSSIFRSGAGSSSSESTTTGAAPAVAIAT